MASKITELRGWDLHVGDTVVPVIGGDGEPERDERGVLKRQPGKQLAFVNGDTGESILIKMTVANAREVAGALIGSGIQITDVMPEVLH